MSSTESVVQSHFRFIYDEFRTHNPEFTMKLFEVNTKSTAVLCIVNAGVGKRVKIFLREVVLLLYRTDCLLITSSLPVFEE